MTACELMKRASKTYERMVDEEDKTEVDTAFTRFQDLRGDFKSLHRIKYDLYIEGIESGIKSDPQSFFILANMKRNSSGFIIHRCFLNHNLLYAPRRL
jgi:hypothetical protein